MTQRQPVSFENGWNNGMADRSWKEHGIYSVRRAWGRNEGWMKADIETEVGEGRGKECRPQFPVWDTTVRCIFFSSQHLVPSRPNFPPALFTRIALFFFFVPFYPLLQTAAAHPVSTRKATYAGGGGESIINRNRVR
ncbi:hypothetical protein LZ32DRAFT_365284 [Colletotrichum eremochloae]|nr:hypothetical protein LZ32DRAFT_365284 [Colletotrichum eremochloae]